VDGDRIATRWRSEGTHQAPMFGVPAGEAGIQERLQARTHTIFIGRLTHAGYSSRAPLVCSTSTAGKPTGQRLINRFGTQHVASMEEIRHSIYTSAMALSIKSDEADQLARELAAETGETLTEAVVIALRERLDREHARHGASMRVRLARLAADVAALPVADGRTPEDIIGYDDAGLPS
jgi:antitoxin VapB